MRNENYGRHIIRWARSRRRSKWIYSRGSRGRMRAREAAPSFSRCSRLAATTRFLMNLRETRMGRRRRRSRSRGGAASAQILCGGNMAFDLCCVCLYTIWWLVLMDRKREMMFALLPECSSQMLPLPDARWWRWWRWSTQRWRHSVSLIICRASWQSKC